MKTKTPRAPMSCKFMVRIAFPSGGQMTTESKPGVVLTLEELKRHLQEQIGYIDNSLESRGKS